MRPKFLAFVKHSENLKAAKEYVAAKKLPDDFVLEGTIDTACEKILQGSRSPEFLLVELHDKHADKAFASLDKLANCCEPDTKVIIVGEIDTLSFYKDLINMGVSEYLLGPIKHEQIEKATQPKAAKKEEKTERSKDDCKVISVVGSRGGVGASTLTLNLAKTFAASGQPTLILDFDPEFGVIPLMLDIEPNRGLVDALEKPERVDALFLERVITKVRDNLFVIGAEKNLSDVSSVSDKATQVILDLLKSKFAYIVIDIPRVDKHSHFLLQHSETILVTELTIPGLRDTMRIYDLINDSLHNKRLTLVANKVGVNKKFETPVKDFESGLGHKIDYVISFENTIYGYSLNGKEGDKELSESKFTKSVHEIALKYANGVESEHATPKASKLGFLDKILPKK